MPGLLALAFIPVLGGTGRLVEVLGGPEVLPTDARFAASPVPLVVHIVASVVYAVLGAFQFSARLRRRHPGWHRRAGRLLVVLGLAVAFSGLWMTLAYPQKEGTGDILWVTRLLVSSGMGASVILGLVAIRRRDIARHRAWMTRAYALALGAGTQAFTVGFGEAALRRRRRPHRPDDGGRLGHQPRRRRVGHPPPRPPPRRACPAHPDRLVGSS